MRIWTRFSILLLFFPLLAATEPPFLIHTHIHAYTTLAGYRVSRVGWATIYHIKWARATRFSRSSLGDLEQMCGGERARFDLWVISPGHCRRDHYNTREIRRDFAKPAIQ